MSSEEFVIRPMEYRDLDQVLRIEQETFPLPFTRSLFEQFMAQEAFYSWVLLNGPEVVGYSIYSYAAGEVDLLNIAVDKNWRRQGIGTRILNHLFEHVGGLGGRRIFLEVRPSNSAAQAFYERFGFVQVSIRKGYYHDSGEDALVYMKELG